MRTWHGISCGTLSLFRERKTETRTRNEGIGSRESSLVGRFARRSEGEGEQIAPPRSFPMNTTITQPYFKCERLDVYRIAVKFHRSLVPLRQVRGAADLRDQILRASESIVLNIAEGAGRFGADDKRRFYRIANGSAMECAGALELLHS